MEFKRAIHVIWGWIAHSLIKIWVALSLRPLKLIILFLRPALPHDQDGVGRWLVDLKMKIKQLI